jgi:hypothetical protein
MPRSRQDYAVLDEHRVENPCYRLPWQQQIVAEPIQELPFCRLHLPVGQYEIGGQRERRWSEASGNHASRGVDHHGYSSATSAWSYSSTPDVWPRGRRPGRCLHPRPHHGADVAGAIGGKRRPLNRPACPHRTRRRDRHLSSGLTVVLLVGGGMAVSGPWDLCATVRRADRMRIRVAVRAPASRLHGRLSLPMRT